MSKKFKDFYYQKKFNFLKISITISYYFYIIFSRTYFIEINTYGIDGITLLESFSDYISLSGKNPLLTSSIQLYGASVSAPPENLYSILVFKMTLAQDLPKSDSGTSKKNL